MRTDDAQKSATSPPKEQGVILKASGLPPLQVKSMFYYYNHYYYYYCCYYYILFINLFIMQGTQQIPSIGLRHPSSHRCHNQLRHGFVLK